MKKIALLMIGFTMLFLTACGGGKDLSVEEVLTQAIDKVESIESYSADIKMGTSIMGMDIEITGESDITHNPDTLYMKMNMGMPGMAMDVEAYFVDGQGYMSMFDEWLMMTEEEMQLDSFDQLNKEELDKLVAFKDDFEMTEEDGMYVLTLAGDGETFKELVNPYLDSSMGGLGEENLFMEDIDFTVDNFETTIWVDKKTMILTSQAVTADITMDGETMTLSSEAHISNIDGVEPIEVPDEVLENAVTEELWEDDMEYEEQDYTVEEIQEIIDFTLPTIGFVPEDYELTSTYYDEEYSGSVLLNYEKDYYNYFTLDIYPSLEAYGEIAFEDFEEITINGAPAYFELIDGNYMYIMWEHDGLFIDLTGDGPDMTKELLIEVAESIE